MEERDRRELLRHVEAVIAWEMEARIGIKRPLNQMPMHIADALLDYFDIEPKEGVVWDEPPTACGHRAHGHQREALSSRS